MFVGYTNDSFFPKQILIFRMLCNISSLDYLWWEIFSLSKGTCGEFVWWNFVDERGGLSSSLGLGTSGLRANLCWPFFLTLTEPGYFEDDWLCSFIINLKQGMFHLLNINIKVFNFLQHIIVLIQSWSVVRMHRSSDCTSFYKICLIYKLINLRFQALPVVLLREIF